RRLPSFARGASGSTRSPRSRTSRPRSRRSPSGSSHVSCRDAPVNAAPAGRSCSARPPTKARAKRRRRPPPARSRSASLHSSSASRHSKSCRQTPARRPQTTDSLARGSNGRGARVDAKTVVEQAWGEPRRQPSRPLRLAAPLAFFSASAVDMTRFGVPTASDRLLLWFTTGLLCCCTYDWRRVRRFVLEWCPLVVLILAYDFARGRAGHFFTQAHVLPQIWVGRYLGGGTVPVVWLQRHLWHGP